MSTSGGVRRHLERTSASSVEASAASPTTSTADCGREVRSSPDAHQHSVVGYDDTHGRFTSSPLRSVRDRQSTSSQPPSAVTWSARSAVEWAPSGLPSSSTRRRSDARAVLAADRQSGSLAPRRRVPSMLTARTTRYAVVSTAPGVAARPAGLARSEPADLAGMLGQVDAPHRGGPVSTRTAG